MKLHKSIPITLFTLLIFTFFTSLAYPSEETAMQQASYQEVSSSQADEYIKTNKPLILDVRTPQEYARGHLENSTLIPVQELQKRINELSAHKNTPILIYCTKGYRSTIASRFLINSGFKTILNLKPGIVDWQKRHYPVTRQ